MKASRKAYGSNSCLQSYIKRLSYENKERCEWFKQIMGSWQLGKNTSVSQSLEQLESLQLHVVAVWLRQQETVRGLLRYVRRWLSIRTSINIKSFLVCEISKDPLIHIQKLTPTVTGRLFDLISCLPSKDGGIRLSAFLKNTTGTLAGSFSTLHFMC